MGDSRSLDEVLVERFVGGDDTALVELVTHEMPHLRVYLANRIPRYLLRRVGVSDILQETALKILSSRRSAFDDPGSFRRFVKVIARRTLANALKRERRLCRDVLRDAGGLDGPSDSGRPVRRFEAVAARQSTPSQVITRLEKLETVRECFLRLPAMHQEIIRLVDEEGLCYEEIGERLELSQEAARKRYSRAMERLRRLTQDAGVTR